MTHFEYCATRCGGPAYCPACNARMIQREGDGLRRAVSWALDNEKRSMTPDSPEKVIERVERYWRDSKRFRDRWRVRF